MNTLPIDFKKYIKVNNKKTLIGIVITVLAIIAIFFTLKFLPSQYNPLKGFAEATPTPTSMPTPIPTARPFPKKAVALTFDDGPKKGVTERILKTLEKHNAKATFFVLGKNAKSNKKLIKAESNAGHEIAIHSYDHTNYGSLSNKKIKSQNNRTSKIIKKITGKAPTLIRTPYGVYSERISRAMNMPIILWSVDTLDWDRRTDKQKKLTIKSATKKTKHGDIVLLHDIHPTTADVLDEILTKLTKKGFEFVTVSEIIEGMNKKNPTIAKNKVYFSGKSSKTLYKIKKK